MIWLSLFDGMSCGQIALQRAGIKVDKYYASEIDKYAQIVSKANYPNTIYLGDCRNIDLKSLDKIDVLIGGSPCQSFSFAGKRKGMSTKSEIEIQSLDQYLKLKSENFEFEGQSYLFFEYLHILTELRKVNPNIKFLLENVEMGEKWEKVLSKNIGVNGIHINSSLVSAQNRKRIYWTNIGMVPGGLFGELESIIRQPKDKGILLKDILESEVDHKYYLKDSIVNKMFKGSDLNGKNNCLRTSGHQLQSNKHNFDLIKIDIKGNIKKNQDKSSCFTAGGNSGGNHSDMDLIKCVAMRGRNPENPKSRKSGLHTEQQLEERNDNKTNCLTSVQKDNLIISGTLRTHNDGKGFREVISEKGATVLARSREDGSGQNIVSIDSKIRRLTPIECERLQTVPDNYTNHVSDSQRYKMLGNGWTVDVIVHILKYL